MAPVERRWADGADVPVRVGRSHALQTPRDPSFLRRAFEVAWRVDGGRSRVVVTNRAGHRVPGLIGREIMLRAEVLDEAGAPIEEAELKIDIAAYLPWSASVEIPLESTQAVVHLVGHHLDPRAEAPVLFLDERLEPSGD